MNYQNTTAVFDIDYKLHELSTRRRILEKQYETRSMALKELNYIKHTSHNRLINAIENQNEKARVRNQQLLQELYSYSHHNANIINSTKPTLSSKTTNQQLKDAKEEYMNYIQSTLPLRCRFESIRLEQKNKELLLEKKLSIKRKEQIKVELDHKNKLLEELEKNRQDLVQSYIDEQALVIDSTKSTILLQQNSMMMDRNILHQLSSLTNTMKDDLYDNMMKLQQDQYHTHELLQKRSIQNTSQPSSLLLPSQQEQSRPSSYPNLHPNYYYPPHYPPLPTDNTSTATDNIQNHPEEYPMTVMPINDITTMEVNTMTRGPSNQSKSLVSNNNNNINNKDDNIIIDNIIDEQVSTSIEERRLVNDSPSSLVVTNQYSNSTVIRETRSPSITSPPIIPTIKISETEEENKHTTIHPNKIDTTTSSIIVTNSDYSKKILQNEYGTVSSPITIDMTSNVIQEEEIQIPTPISSFTPRKYIYNNTATTTSASMNMNATDTIHVIEQNSSSKSNIESSLDINKSSTSVKQTVQSNLFELLKNSFSIPKLTLLLSLIVGQIEQHSSLVLLSNDISHDNNKSITHTLTDLKAVYNFSDFFTFQTNYTKIFSMVILLNNQQSSQLNQYQQLQSKPLNDDDSDSVDFNDEFIDELESLSMNMLGDFVIMIVFVQANHLIPSSAFSGVVSVEKLKAEYKRIGPLGILKLWDTLISHFQLLVSLKQTNLEYLSSNLTILLTTYLEDSEDKNRLIRKVSNLLQLALIPKDFDDPNRSPSPPYRTSNNNYHIKPTNITTLSSNKSNNITNTLNINSNLTTLSTNKSNAITNIVNDEIEFNNYQGITKQIKSKTSSTSLSPSSKLIELNNNIYHNTTLKKHNFTFKDTAASIAKHLTEFEEDEIESDTVIEKPPPMKDLDTYQNSKNSNINVNISRDNSNNSSNDIKNNKNKTKQGHTREKGGHMSDDEFDF